MRNARTPTMVTLSDIEQALDALGLAHDTQVRREPNPLRFCSYFAQEDRGVYFWEDASKAPAFTHTDIVVLTSGNWPGSDNIACLIRVAHPQAAYYLLMRHFFAADEERHGGIHPTAIVSGEAHIGHNAHIGPYCVVEADCDIGDDVHLDSHVVVKAGSTIGHRVRIESHTTIGATGVAWVWHEGQRIMQPQIGGTRIGDDCFLGTDITIVRGSINEITTVGARSVMAHGTKIGHGCQIGEDVHFANNVTIAGNCRIGDRAFLSAASVLRPRIHIAPGVTVGAGAVVTRNVDEANTVVSGVPARAMAAKDQHAGVPRNCNVEGV